MSEDLTLGEQRIHSGVFFHHCTATPLIRLNLFNSLHLFCRLVLYLEWNWNKTKHFDVAQCLTSCHCSMAAFPASASISFCLRVPPGLGVELLKEVTSDKAEIRMDRSL